MTMLSEMRIVEREFARRPASADDGAPSAADRRQRRWRIPAWLLEVVWLVETPYAAALLRPTLRDN